MKDIKIALFDDHPFTANGLSNYLYNNGFEIAFCSNTKSDLFEQLNKLELDILILDIIAPDVLGLELFEVIAAKHPEIKIIAHSTLSSVMLLENLLSIGVRGFVNKKQNEKDIITCIEQVLANEISVPEEYLFLTSKYRQSNSHILTPREVQVLKFIAEELTSQEIADKLGISVFTIENHRKNIFKKLEVKNIAGLIMSASRLGYIS
jgi:DNA-binding NarL/FixJ family response regulator